ncbi:hypothetical protein [Mycobacteroides abscessus]|uniref:hypothetical protein n=1 Tax=Mycobacteroides abscessus TaxID=36809 RepID=UPI00105514B9|nr:hypothetical protein [Mycobacteroides abscessus]
MTEAALRVPDTHDRKDLGTFLARVSQLDESAVVRLRARGDGRVVIWAATQFDVLACRAGSSPGTWCTTSSCDSSM